MRSTLRNAVPPTIEISRTDGQITDQTFGSILTDIVLLLYPPPNTAAQVAVLINSSVRKAEKCLAGHHKWSGDDIAAIVSEILRRHRMRNVKIIAR